MEFLKKNYEKILLATVLLGLAVAAAALPFGLQSESASLAQIDDALPEPNIYKPVDLTGPQTALDRMKSPPTLVLHGQHNTFNSVLWKQLPAGTLAKLPPGTEGAGALKVLATRPLRFEIAYSRSTDASSHFFMVTREAHPNRAARRPTSRFARVGEKFGDMPVVLKEVRAGAGGSQQYVLELSDTKETVIVTADKPYSRIEAYAADLRYEIENRSFNDQRVGDIVSFDGDHHKIVVITATQVRIQTTSTQKQTTLFLQGSP